MFKGDALTMNTSWWLGLHSTSLSTAALPTTATEVTRANGYARIKAANTSGTGNSTDAFSSATSVTHIKNTTGFQFPDPSASWSTIYAVALYDSSVTSGAGASTCWFFQNINTTTPVSAGNPVRFSSGQLDIWLE